MKNRKGDCRPGRGEETFMSLKQNSYFERLITHAVLIVGCFVFSFPFAWMVMTSIKVKREMNITELRLFPQKPAGSGKDRFSKQIRLSSCVINIVLALDPMAARSQQPAKAIPHRSRSTIDHIERTRWIRAYKFHVVCHGRGTFSGSKAVRLP